MSVVVVNYNYGRFLAGALLSVAAQTYPNIEAVVVDDMSTDDSRALLASLTATGAAFEGVRTVLMERNGGQTLASAHGFAAAGGAYVIFLDADDELLPRCVESHVYAHLSSRIPIGFSTVDTYNEVDGQRVTTGCQGFASFVTSGRGRHPQDIRPIDIADPDIWFAQREAPLRPDEIHLAKAPCTEPWIWSPTSANCFRREALERLLHGAHLAAIRFCTDAYLIWPIAALHGSALIDRPLMRYRIHGGNSFISGAPLAGTNTFDVRGQRDALAAILKAAVHHILDELPNYARIMVHPYVILEALKALCDTWPKLQAANGSSYLAEQLRPRERLVEELFGREVLTNWLWEVRDERVRSVALRLISRIRRGARRTPTGT